MRLLLILALLGSAFVAQAQRRFGLELTDRFPVVVGPDTLANPWAGGLNSASYSKIDLNADGVPDLCVHDHTAQRYLTFVATNGPAGWYWRHEPAYESVFPSDNYYVYVGLRDYDGDGRPDLFASFAAQFWALYRNVAYPGGVGFRFELVEDTLHTETNLGGVSTSIYGQAAIEDFDNDGDPDILDFAYGSNYFSLFRNLGASPGTAPRFHQEFLWGDVTRCIGGQFSCQSYAFSGTFCRPTQPTQPTHGSNTDYALAAPDLDGDGDRDLLIAQQYCRDLALLQNQGTSAAPVFSASSLVVPYPAGPPAATLVNTPAPTYADFTFDGQPDLLLSPWLTGFESMVNPYVGDQYDTRHAAWLYRRTGPGLADFQFQQDDFLQRAMIDVGNQSAPTLGDLDGDGDLDLLVGNQGDLVFTAAPVNSFTSFRGKLAFYRNVGTPQRAIFRLDDPDFGQFSLADKRALVPVLTDLDQNGTLDLVLRYSADHYAGAPYRLAYILNTAPAGQLAVFPPANLTALPLTGPFDDRMVPCFQDVDGDGDRDILVGTREIVGFTEAGALRLFVNQGGPPGAVPAFTYAATRYGRLPFVSGTLAPAVADLDGDGQPELLTATDDGELRVWPGVLQATTTPISTLAEASLVRNALTNYYGPAGLGFRLALTTGDLDADGRAEVLVGTAGGGVRLLRSQPTGFTGLAELLAAADGPHVFPNPAAGTCVVELPATAGSRAGGAADALATVTLRDALGCRVWQSPATGLRLVVPLAGLAPGIYGLTITTATGRTFGRRLSVAAP